MESGDKMTTRAENRKVTLDHMVDEKVAEIFFLAKEEYDIESNGEEEQKLFDLLNKFKHELKEDCKHHFHIGE